MTHDRTPPRTLQLEPNEPTASRSAVLLHGGVSDDAAIDREARRINLAIVGLVLTVLMLLNVAIYQGTRARLVEEQTDALAHRADRMRADLRAAITQLARNAEFAAQSDEVVALAAGDVDRMAIAPAGPELERATASFRFQAARVVAADGTLLAERPGVVPRDVAHERDLVARALETRRTAVAAGRPAGGPPAIAIAVPIVTARGVAAAVFEASIATHLQPLLSRGPLSSRGSGAYLVTAHDRSLVVMSAPPVGAKVDRRGAMAADDPRHRAAAMAAGAVESTFETAGLGWHVTRQIPELGLGLVAHADHHAILSGTRTALLGLLALDLGTVGILFGFVWVWRRQYRGRLDRQRAEQAKRHSEDVAAVLDHAFDAILIFDRGGRVRVANRAAERMFQRAADEMIGAPSHQFIEWNSAGRPGAIEPLAIGRVSRTEIVRADGTFMPVEFSLGCSGGGDSLLYTAIIRDISERVEAENRIRHIAQGLEVSNRRLQEANAQLEEASRLKSEFLANTSHELRTPLNGIIGFLQLVLDGMCDTRDEEREFLGQALQCSRHLLGLINDVLDIAKIEAGKLSLEHGPIDVRGLFKEVHTLTHVQAAQKGVALTFTVAEAQLPAASGDLGKVKQVLVNLVGNSIKFTPRGRISVNASVHAELGHIAFEVVDTGVGIPKDRQRVIFEKFTQADGSTTRRFGGTGLGLAICRSLVELMGGVIGVESEGEGKGTRMYFALPIWRGERAAEADEAEADERIHGPAGGAVILLVEDDSVFRQFLSALLHRHGYRTLEAANADTAWVLLRRMRPNAVLIDYALTSSEGAGLRTGWDLARRMAEDGTTRRIPIVFVTGFGNELQDKLNDTAFARRPEYLAKPVDARDLIKRIEKILGPVVDRPVRLLLADDDPAVAAYLRKLLPESRYQVEVANDGDECLHVLRTQPQGFDLLLLDLMMPNVSGYDVLRQMTLTGAGAQLPVLVLTNCPEPRNEEERRLLENGIVLEVVSKSSVHGDHRLLPELIENRLGLARASEWPLGEDEAREAA